ncbi:hypothetical protein [Actinotalea sp. K2]|uniref:hypothetical protein n=1 Tax=Actinotalea sp. K2 TaxID=2939438 RepID=UPI002017AF80|nr:hypothetical protein [Actinotalea sp. K2]MCL3859565.1 hypothetical protein [Actinotalea sp. K2]
MGGRPAGRHGGRRVREAARGRLLRACHRTLGVEMAQQYTAVLTDEIEKIFMKADAIV